MSADAEVVALRQACQEWQAQADEYKAECGRLYGAFKTETDRASELQAKLGNVTIERDNLNAGLQQFQANQRIQEVLNTTYRRAIKKTWKALRLEDLRDTSLGYALENETLWQAVAKARKALAKI